MPGTNAKWLTAVSVACAAALAFAPGAEAMVIDSETASGHHAFVAVAGVIVTPSSISLRVTARPRQRVSGSWMMVCSAGLVAGSEFGQFSGRSTLRRRLRMPNLDADHCTVSASARLAGGGRIRLTLLARRATEPRRHG